MKDGELEDRLAEALVGYGLLTETQLERARSFQRTQQATLAAALVDLQLLTDEMLRGPLQELTGVRAVNPSLLTVYSDFVERMNLLLPADVVARLLVFPAQMEINTIHVCMLNPTDGWTTRALESISGCRVLPLVAHERSLQHAIERHYRPYVPEGAAYDPSAREAAAERTYRTRLEEPFDALLKPAAALVNRQRDTIARGDGLETIIRDPAVIRVVHQILCRAIEAGASDIHIEPLGDSLRVRVRVDGAMRVAHVLPPAMSLPLSARLRAMADLPLTATTGPLDGRIGYDLVWGRPIDLRFSLVPSISGDKIVLRVLDRARERRELSSLGVDPETQAALEQASDLPNGLILVTGPTGSGKSSTLYALLDRLNTDDACILTAEDPVESRVPGVTQVQCDEGAGVSFASALRSFLRQDPDVLMVGEVRDAETADIALKSALTGHLVLSTLHTNDSPGAVLRLLNMNLEPFLVASALRLVIAQRLVRRLCRNCRVAVPPKSNRARALLEPLAAHNRDLLHHATIYEAGGCRECGDSGYRGRVGIFEALRVTEPLEDLIISRASASAIRVQARREGMRTLREAGLRKVLEGETSIAEVLEHTISDAAVDALSGAAHV
jgi:type IV pilus assembly protein PilB